MKCEVQRTKNRGDSPSSRHLPLRLCVRPKDPRGGEGTPEKGFSPRRQARKVQARKGSDQTSPKDAWQQWRLLPLQKSTIIARQSSIPPSKKRGDSPSSRRLSLRLCVRPQDPRGPARERQKRVSRQGAKLAKDRTKNIHKRVTGTNVIRMPSNSRRSPGTDPGRFPPPNASTPGPPDLCAWHQFGGDCDLNAIK